VWAFNKTNAGHVSLAKWMGGGEGSGLVGGGVV